MEHPTAIRPQDHAEYRADRMGKATLFRSDRMLVGLNAFEPGQEHALHAHAGMDKVYHVVEGEGVFLLEGQELPMQAGMLLVAPDGVPHGIRNTGAGRLLVLAILAPAPVLAPMKAPSKLPKFRVKPHHGGFAPGVDPLKLNQILDQMEVEDFLEEQAASDRAARAKSDQPSRRAEPSGEKPS